MKKKESIRKKLLKRKAEFLKKAEASSKPPVELAEEFQKLRRDVNTFLAM